jgi:hypothetical protein
MRLGTENKYWTLIRNDPFQIGIRDDSGHY